MDNNSKWDKEGDNRAGVVSSSTNGLSAKQQNIFGTLSPYLSPEQDNIWVIEGTGFKETESSISVHEHQKQVEDNSVVAWSSWWRVLEMNLAPINTPLLHNSTQVSLE